jgi:hypothetical protein|nr:MAG TPA: hypothetical protein [Caudoviricetes sp.]
MPSQNTDPKVWKYFKTGDIVRDSDDSVWGKTKFEITGFHGNWYCPMLSTNICGKFYPSGNPQRCNLGVREAKLISAPRRPFRNMPKKVLIKLMGKGNVEAKREFMMRLNTKSL